MLRNIKCIFILTVIAGLLLVGVNASANSLTFDWAGSAGVYDGTAIPTVGGGSIQPAYLQAMFMDTGNNEVTLTITANMVSPADIDQITFNVLPDELAGNLLVSSMTSNVTDFQQSLDSIHNGSVHTFDVLFGTGQGVNGLGGQDTATVVLTLKPTSPSGLTLDALSFNASTPGTITDGPNAGDPIDIFAAAHFQNIGKNNNDSSFIASGTPAVPGPGLPLPSSALAGSALLSVLALSKKRRGARA